MIDTAVQTVAHELNEFFRLKFGLVEDRVVISNVVNSDGTPAVKDDNRVLVSLVLVQEEKMGAYKVSSPVSPGGVKPIYLNLFLLFSAQFNEKLNIEALKFISAVITFFQSKPVFTQGNSSGLGDGLEKLSFEISNMSLQEQSNLWSTIGGKYMPSVLYKVRVVTIDEKMLSPETISVEGMDRGFKQ